MASLCVNIDHIATLRQARRGTNPDPAQAVEIVERAGSTGVTVHLREDRRHIQEADVRMVKELVRGHLNLEMAATAAMVDFALALRPDMATLVPERREEVTTEGGLDVAGNFEQVRQAAQRLNDAGIVVSLFIAADPHQLDASLRAGAAEVEFHTGPYSHAQGMGPLCVELKKIEDACRIARGQGLVVNAGHGLNYGNAAAIAAIEGMHELNIGHAIISRAIFSGLQTAVEEMTTLIAAATRHPETYRMD